MLHLIRQPNGKYSLYSEAHRYFTETNQDPQSLLEGADEMVCVGELSWEDCIYMVKIYHGVEEAWQIECETQ